MDEQVGRLWDQLEAWGQASNTLLCFASDNGPERDTPGSAGPFRERKRSLHEGGLRVPAFWVLPDILEGKKEVDAPTVTHDYLPTIVELLDLAYPSGRILDGMSLLPLLTGTQNTREKAIGFLYPKKQSWVTDQYKLISKDEGKTWELYDLLSDPGEQVDLAESHPRWVPKNERGIGSLGSFLWSKCKRGGVLIGYDSAQNSYFVFHARHFFVFLSSIKDKNGIRAA